MADIKSRIVQVGPEAITLGVINEQLQLMLKQLQLDLGLGLTLHQGFITHKALIDQLREMVKDKEVGPRQLFDSSLVTEEDYTTMTAHISSLPPTAFEPPLGAIQTSSVDTNISIYPVPHYPETDPRRTGRLITLGQQGVANGSSVRLWLANNSLLYGFLLYGKNALYYVGVEQIKQIIRSGRTVSQVVSQFLPQVLTVGLTTTSDTVLGTSVASPTAQAIDLEYVLGNVVVDNAGHSPTLVVVDNKFLEESLAVKYTQMRSAAAQDGVTLKLNSGFRPPYGPSLDVTTSKGRTLRLTTQQAIRSDTSRWLGRVNWPGDDESFILEAPSSMFRDKTAKPGSSNHGNGTAIDMLTGRMSNNSLNVPVYSWLIRNSWKFGFVRTVASEEWHFDYLPNLASNGPYARLAGTNSNLFFSSLGLSA